MEQGIPAAGKAPPRAAPHTADAGAGACLRRDGICAERRHSRTAGGWRACLRFVCGAVLVRAGRTGAAPVVSGAAGAGGIYRRLRQPRREGYTFEGWYRDAARTDAWDFAADTVEQDTILYAKWEAVPAQDTTSGAALPQTGVATGALLWACVLAAALALAAAAALLLRRAYRG